MLQGPKVIGKISLPLGSPSRKCTCDECGDVLNDSCGDPRVRVSRYDSMDSTSVRWICDVCADEQFGDHSSHSIFE